MDPEASAILEQLRQENQALRARVAELEEALGRLQRERQQVQDQLDEARRGAARQAAPFRRPERAKLADDRKKPPGASPDIPAHIARPPRTSTSRPRSP